MDILLKLCGEPVQNIRKYAMMEFRSQKCRSINISYHLLRILERHLFGRCFVIEINYIPYRTRNPSIYEGFKYMLKVKGTRHSRPGAYDFENGLLSLNMKVC